VTGVLIIVENLPCPFDRRVWQEALTLKDAGHRVSIICPTGKGYEERFERLDGIHIYRYRLPLEADSASSYVVEYLWALFMQSYLAFKVHFTRGFDVIHACNPPDTIFIISYFFKVLGKKFLFDHHDANPELYLAKFDRKDWWYGLLVRLERWTFRAADASIATNDSYKRIAIERGGMPPDRVTVVRSGPDLARVRPVPPCDLYKQGKDYLVGYVGVMGRQEGLDYLLRSVRYLVHDVERKDTHFCLVGSGTEIDSLQRYACELGVADYVTFTGRISDRELMEILSTADICVNPDVANDLNDISTMNKIMEYMAIGKPIVQFDLREGRYSAQSASLYAKKNDEVDFAQKILILLDDPELRMRMGAFGRERIQKQLAWEYEQPKLLAAYDALLERKDAPTQQAS